MIILQMWPILVSKYYGTVIFCKQMKKFLTYFTTKSGR